MLKVWGRRSSFNVQKAANGNLQWRAREKHPPVTSVRKILMNPRRRFFLMVRRRSPGSALALSGAPSRTMRKAYRSILRDAAKTPLLRACEGY